MVPTLVENSKFFRVLVIIGVLQKEAEKLLKDRYTLIERSNTLIEQPGHFKLTICIQYQGFNCMIIYNSEACTSCTSVSSSSL